jgi:hypothetical protein
MSNYRDNPDTNFNHLANPYKRQMTGKQAEAVSSPNDQQAKSSTSISSIVTPATVRTSSNMTFQVNRSGEAREQANDQAGALVTVPFSNEKSNKNAVSSVSKNDSRGNKRNCPSPPRGDRPLKSILCNTKYSGPFQPTITQLNRQVQYDIDEQTKNKDNNKVDTRSLTFVSNEQLTLTSSLQKTPQEASEGSESPLTSYIAGGDKDTQFLGDTMCDLRGFVVGKDGHKLPTHYCRHCLCPPIKCHELLLGELIELEVMSDVMDIDLEPTVKHVEELVQQKYEKALRLKIYDDTRTLDISEFKVPYCVEIGTQGRLCEYIKMANYHYDMQKLITMGRDKPIFVQFGKNKRDD